jgi:hypothetical protein
VREITDEDFSHIEKNPYFDKFMTKFEISIRKEDYMLFLEVGKINGVPAEMIMRNCLADWADKMRQHE